MKSRKNNIPLISSRFNAQVPRGTTREIPGLDTAPGLINLGTDLIKSCIGIKFKISFFIYYILSSRYDVSQPHTNFVMQNSEMKIIEI